MQLASYFESRVRYDFLTWNCHSFVASCLNEVKYPRSRLASALGGWSVVSLALFIFIWGRHIGPCGWLKQWGGSFAVASIVAGVRISSGTWAPLWTFLLAVACTNIFFVLWFGLLTVCQVSSQYGRTPHRRLDETDSEPELEEEEEHLSAYG